MKRSIGKLSRNGENWILEGEPHLLMRVKRIFGRVNSQEHDHLTITSTEEVCRDLEWLRQRYLIDISREDLRDLRRRSRRHQDRILRMEEILGDRHEPKEFDLAIPAREYQRRAAELMLTRKFLLLADEVGLGKTATSICTLTQKGTLPAVVVTLSGALPEQWRKELEKFAPGLSVHVLRKGTPYELPKFFGKGPDVLVLNYHKLDGWAKVLGQYARTVIFDEIQELRRSGSLKYIAAVHVARKATYRYGLSATPIYNYGGEIWNVLNVLSQHVVGTESEFLREWCHGVYTRNISLRDPAAFGTYLRENFIMLRRTAQDVQREIPEPQRTSITVPSDEAAFRDVENRVRELAEIILSGKDLARGEAWTARRELDMRLRQATGVGKAPACADFVQMLVESGEHVVVYAWHRAVYDVLMDRLKDLRPAMYTGSETPAKKTEAKQRFVDGDTPVFLASLRAGAGLDGLQHRSRTVVFAELDWSPGIHEQCIGRVARDGQKASVMVYFLVSEDGSDPVIAETLGIKEEQVEGIRNPRRAPLEARKDGSERIREIARKVLQKSGRSRKATGAAS